MVTATPHQPLDRLDQIMAEIQADQATILQIVADALAAHQGVDAEYSPRLNPLYRRVWELFLEGKAIADAHQAELLTRGRKSSKRNNGTVGWRANSELILHVDLPQLIARIKAMGRGVSRKLLRRVVSWELRASSIKAVENADLIAGIDGLEVLRRDDFYMDPKQGFRLSTASPWWPVLEGQTGIGAFQTLFRNPEAPPGALS